ncbi:hypothetical protein Q9233_006867 [Columba guinea]|nr:hypothetical protein Q9233_006867 [Columba guinea]
MLQQQRGNAVREARELQRQLAKELVRGAGSSSRARAELQDVLSKLRWESRGEQAARVLRLEDQLLQQRRLFLKYILERPEGEQPASCTRARAWHRRGPSLPNPAPQTHLQSALKDLERRCGVLQGNGLLGKASCPQVRGEVDGLKQKAAKLALISKQLEERARQLREAIAHLGTPGCRQP